VHSILSRDFFAATREWNLREGMFSALELIAANPGISQVRVSEEIGLDRSAMVLVMDELEKRLWAQRQRCARDRRRHRLSITPAGSKVLDELFRCMEQAEERALAVLDARELAIVRRALDRVFVAYTTADIRPDALRTGDAPRRRAAVRKRTERR
jgi:DNA-binding MarR family transcriptional regulator